MWVIALLGAAVVMFASVILLLEPIKRSMNPEPSPSVVTPATPSEKDPSDMIRVSAPQRNETIANPLRINGEARGTYFFEASFPIKLLDGNGQEVATGIANADGEWMTEEFVPFSATLTFVRPATANGSLAFMRDNPSGLPENDMSFVVPVSFGEELTPPVAPSSTVAKGECRPSGCSGEVCSDEDMVSTCIYKPEFACYQKATCGKNKTTGKCEWEQTTELKNCVAKAKTESVQVEISY